MAMDLTHTFTVPAPIDEVWAAFNDLERIAPCFPGAALTSYDGAEFVGTVKVKLGPISLQYSGTGRFVTRDEAAGTAVVEAKGKDKRGNGTAAASVSARLTARENGSTEVEVATSLNVTGKPAQFGRGIMQEVSDKLLGQFTTCLATKLGPVGTPAPSEPGGRPSESGGRPSESGDLPSESSDRPAEPVRTRAARHVAPTEPGRPAALDLGTTVFPVLARRYAPYLIGGLIALLVLRRLLRRS